MERGAEQPHGHRSDSIGAGTDVGGVGKYPELWGRRDFDANT